MIFFSISVIIISIIVFLFTILQIQETKQRNIEKEQIREIRKEQEERIEKKVLSELSRLQKRQRELEFEIKIREMERVRRLISETLSQLLFKPIKKKKKHVNWKNGL